MGRVGVLMTMVTTPYRCTAATTVAVMVTVAAMRPESAWASAAAGMTACATEVVGVPIATMATGSAAFAGGKKAATADVRMTTIRMVSARAVINAATAVAGTGTEDCVVATGAWVR